jgi:hypothetical protein
MRSDMAKVIVERPRGRRHAGPYRGSDYPRGTLKPRDLESAPLREAMGRGYETKYLNENLGPLKRYLQSQVGRAWSLVFSEIAAHINVRSAVQKHIVDHIYRDLVAISPEPERRFCRPSKFYVCPRTGVLCATVRARPRVRLPDPNVRKIDDATELRRIDGVWYRVGFAISGAQGGYDVLLRAQAQPRTRHACTKRQLSTREIARLVRA